MQKYMSQEDENFFGAIGRLTICWAHLEFGLDAMVEVMHSGFGGKHNEGDIPRELSRKIRYLRSAFKRIPIPQDAIDCYLSLLDEIAKEAETRHDIIHGVVIKHEEKSGEAIMVRISRKKDQVIKKEFNTTTAQILRAAVRTQRLNSKVLYIVNNIHDLLRELLRQPI